MNASHFEFSVSVPSDERYVDTIRQLAVEAACYAGCPREEAETFGRAVDAAVRGCFADAGANTDVPVVVRRTSGPVEVLVDERTIAVNV